MLSLFSTMTDPPPAQGGRHAYPGTGQYGLIGNDPLIARPTPLPDIVAYYSTVKSSYNVVAAYIVPPAAYREGSLTMQRALQLERAVQAILQSGTLKPPGMNQPLAADAPVVATGTSYGGLTSQLLTAWFPNRVHGAVSYSLSASSRRTQGDQEMYTFISSLSGFGWDGRGYGDRDSLEWATAYRQNGYDFYTGSYLPLWATGRIHRPQYFIDSDEDTVTNGNEWLSVLAGVRAYDNAGSVTNTSTGATVYWSRVNKACHDSYQMVIPGALTSTGQDTTEQHIDFGLFAFLPKAVQSFTSQPSVPSPTPASGSAASEDVYDHVFGRPSTSARNAAHGAQPVLVAPDPAWSDPHEGAGTWLGHGRSMVTAGEAIYVGSAGGVVSKLRANTTEQPARLEVVTRTESLGYGAHALAHSGSKLAVATFGWLYVLDAATLGVLAQKQLPWEHTRPRHMEIADLFGNGDYIVFRGMHGEVACYELANLDNWFDVSEPGVADIAIGGSRRDPAWSLPIFLLSERGRIIKIEIAAATRTPKVTGMTPGIVGSPLDFEWFTQAGADALVAFYRLTGAPNNIKIISGDHYPSATNMLELCAFDDFADRAGGQSEYGAPADTPGTGDIEFLPGEGVLADGFVVLMGDKIEWISTCGTQDTYLDLAPLNLLHYPLDIEVADLGDLGTHSKEIVVATESGSVAAFSADAFVTGSISQVVAGPGVVASWGMTSVAGKLELVDQTAQRWQADPLVNAKAMALEVLPGPNGEVARKPFRDLAYLGYSPSALSGSHNLIAPIVGFSDTYVLLSQVNCPVVAGGVPGEPPAFLPPAWAPQPWTSGSSWDAVPQSQIFAKQFAPLALGGDAITIAGDTHVYFWSGYPAQNTSYRNQVRGLVYDPGGLTDASVWCTATVHNDPSLITPSAAHLRSVFTPVAMDCQSLRTGIWPGGKLRIVVGTSGGSAIVLRPKPGTPVPSPLLEVYAEGDHEAPYSDAGDHGFGGIALCVDDVRDDGWPVIFFGTVATHASIAAGETDMVASLHIYEHNAGAGTLAATSIEFDGQNEPKLFGLCGIAAGDLDGVGRVNVVPGTADKLADELVLTTLNGDLVIYDLHVDLSTGAVSLGPLRHWRVYDGALGAYNAIRVENADGAGCAELYVASSLGLRRFKHCDDL